MGKPTIREMEDVIVRDLNDIKDLLSEVLRRLGSMEYTGKVTYENLLVRHVGQIEKQVDVSLKRKRKENE
jgi:hypothetical protein